MLKQYVTAIAGYSVTYALAWVGARYHLTGDQMTALTADAFALGAAMAGVFAHVQAAKSPPPA